MGTKNSDIFFRPRYSSIYHPRQPGVYYINDKEDFLGPLPETEFYELDKVTLKGNSAKHFAFSTFSRNTPQLPKIKMRRPKKRSPEELLPLESRNSESPVVATIIGINYSELVNPQDPQRKVYRVSSSINDSWFISVPESDIGNLVKRGDVWRHFKGAKLEDLPEIEDLACFYLAVDACRIPLDLSISAQRVDTTSFYDPIRLGTIDAFCRVRRDYPDKPLYEGIKFKDRPLGEDIRAEFIRTFIR